MMLRLFNVFQGVITLLSLGVRSKRQFSLRQQFGFFLIMYFILWAIVPSFLLHSMYPDSAENLTLGHVLSWSYSKHPPLGMLLLRLFSSVIPNIQFAVYFASGLCLILSLIFLYKISRLYLEKKDAIAATVLSTLSIYFMLNFSMEYNQNTIMLPFWAASIYYTLKVQANNRWCDWLCLSVICFLGVMAKYETLLIIGLECAFLGVYFDKKYLKKFFTSLILFLLLLSPHVYWVLHHPDNPVTYFFGRSAGGNHLKGFFGSLVAQPLDYFLVFLTLMVLIKCKCAERLLKRSRFKLTHPLVFFALTPWFIFCLMALFTGVSAEWGYPLLLLICPAFFYCYDIKAHSLKVLMLTVLALQLTLFSVYMGYVFNSHKTTEINYPGSQLALATEKFWVSQHRPLNQLQYVGGQQFAVYYLASYLPTKPLMLKDTSFTASPWINKKKFFLNGAVFVNKGCDTSKNFYQKRGFQVAASKCVYINQANKWHPVKLPYTLFLIA
jgi:hypothetical protein